ncbi:glucose-methanol-choline (gmc) oxidoreductase [Penicillium lagena]|uniref:glucose-methanol-choline (gmc) oxidoreductase n=1 Tax=Penicillium lagena TaxID=94218 RepID=UPI002540107D|nr:glucose-methanol-choline (gmc) oxidoreductase [Penicillium lagena]KAJ5605314.1 glucose-methanol-choline (gmc) oxidoreductase [Penicillium lagena]
MKITGEIFDFIVVGIKHLSGQIVALVLATRLANADLKPSVLLIEAGGPQPSNESLSLANRWDSDTSHADINWNYVSLPEPELNDRPIDVSRGKALGGTSNINYLCWTPPTPEYIAEWQARVGGDSFFNWNDTQRLLDGLVNYNIHTLTGNSEYPLHAMTDVPLKDFVTDIPRDANGPFNLTYSTYLKQGDLKLLQGAEEAGFLQNKHIVAGSSLGYGIMASMSTANGYLRSTPSEAFLTDKPDNLVIKTGLEATRILFEGKTAEGVEQNGGEQCFTARLEVILSAGSINTPKLLILSGVGPKVHIKELGIPLIADLPGVGQHLQDHYAIPFQWETNESFADTSVPAVFEPIANQDLFNAVVIFDRDKAMVDHACFSELPLATQRWLGRKNAPHLELLAVNNWKPGPSPPGKPNIFLVAVGLAPQSEGSIILPSADWHDAPNIQLNLLSDKHGLDFTSAISYTRKALEVIEHTDSVSPHIASPRIRPNSDSEADIAAFLREHVMTLWHPTQTTRMGPRDDEGDSVVDPSFRVRGLNKLRIADLGVVPVMPNSHPASVALLVGAWVAERIISEYSQ